MRIDGSRNAADEKRTTQPGQTPAVIDWEYTALGDPAYDLAIVTRGARRPFQNRPRSRQVAGGLQRRWGSIHHSSRRTFLRGVHCGRLGLRRDGVR
ncbi:MAG: phosphotransferase [Myxococcales bacterium]